MTIVRDAMSDPRPQRLLAFGSWKEDRLDAMLAANRLAWLVAGSAALVALLEAVALLLVFPLKTTVPYTITVDRQTGFVETVRTLAPGPVAQDAALTQSFLAQYIAAREGFEAATLTEDYRRVMLFSDGDARAQYANVMERSNSQSPLVRYGADTIVRTAIKNISLLSPTSAIVRFDATTGNGEAPNVAHPYSAVLSFRYVSAPMSMGDRFVNPLGFQIVRYRRDDDLAPGPVQGSAP